MVLHTRGRVGRRRLFKEREKPFGLMTGGLSRFMGGLGEMGISKYVIVPTYDRSHCR